MAFYDPARWSGKRSSPAKSGGVSVKLDGFSDLDAALGELPKALGRAVMRRVLLRAGQPIAQAAKRLVPRRTGKLGDSIAVSTKAKNSAGVTAYATTLREGGSKQEAIASLRLANRTAKAAKSTMEVYVGPAAIPYASLVEFGTAHSHAQPYMRPAWEAEKDAALDIVKAELGTEIDKAAARLAKKAAKGG